MVQAHASHFTSLAALRIAACKVEKVLRPANHLALRETPFLSHLYLKTIILPRQARDKHRKNSKKMAFFAPNQTATALASNSYRALRTSRERTTPPTACCRCWRSRPSSGRGFGSRSTTGRGSSRSSRRQRPGLCQRQCLTSRDRCD